MTSPFTGIAGQRSTQPVALLSYRHGTRQTCHVSVQPMVHGRWNSGGSTEGGDKGDRLPPLLKVGNIELIQEEHVSTHVSQSETGSLTDLTRSEPVDVYIDHGKRDTCLQATVY